MNETLMILNGATVWFILFVIILVVIGAVIKTTSDKTRTDALAQAHQSSAPPPLPTGETETMFQIARAGKVLGTFPQSAIAYKLKWSQGEILPTDFYWTSGMSEWKKVSEKTDWEIAPISNPKTPHESEATKPLTGVKSINGTVLSFSIQNSAGLIAGDDSVRYSFTNKAWRTGIVPTSGMRVTFVPQDSEAADVFPLSHGTQSSQAGGKFFRSSNRKVIGGVCAGLATNWKIDVVMLRVIFCAVTLFGSMMVFGLVVPVIYLGLWIFTAEAPTE